ncbi:hypothetical protein F3K44_01300 [Bacillus megaterium]|nr:hypothetical protein [Priestia megaterium]
MDSAFWFFMIGILAAFLLFGYQLVISKKLIYLKDGQLLVQFLVGWL